MSLTTIILPVPLGARYENVSRSTMVRAHHTVSELLPPTPLTGLNPWGIVSGWPLDCGAPPFSHARSCVKEASAGMHGRGTERSTPAEFSQKLLAKTIVPSGWFQANLARSSNP